MLKNGTAVIERPQTIHVEPMDIQVVRLKILGDTPLIMHRWDEKAKAMIRDKQAKAATKGREARNPEAEFNSATYFIDKDRFGFPATAFKSAMVDAALAMGAKKTETRRAFHVAADAHTVDGQMVEIFSPKRTMREDMVKVGVGIADLRYRPEFMQWSAIITINFDPRQISVQQLIKLANQAGFSTGIGEWRPERDGSYGQFHVEAIAEVE